MKTIHTDVITENIKQMCIEANLSLSADMKENFEKQLDALDWGVFDCFGNDNTPEGKGKIGPIGALSIADIEKKKEEYVKRR